MKKILIISPLYPFPQKCGLSLRIFDLCRHISDIFELHLFTFSANPEQKINHEALRIFKNITITGIEGSPLSAKNNFLARVYRKFFPPNFDDEYYFSDSLLRKLSSLQSKEDFDACMIVTPILARALNAFPPSVLKIIDSIDIWNQRYEEFKKIGQASILNQFRSASREIEIFRNADMVIAISLWDHDYMLNNGLNPIYTPVSFEADPLPQKSPPSHDILYPGGSGPTNIDAICFFIREIMPLIKQSFPDARLIVPGASDELKAKSSNVENLVLLPFMNEIRDAYQIADIVAVPLRIGTGIKIKVLESLAFGKATVISPAAAQGMRLGNFAQKRISINPEVFASEIIKVFKSDDYKNELISSGIEIIRTEYKPQKVYADLRTQLMEKITKKVTN